VTVMDKHKIASALIKIARTVLKTAWGNKPEGILTTPWARLTVHRENFYLDELPVKGKTKLRKAYNNFAWEGDLQHGHNELLAANILQDAKVSNSDTYDAIKEKLDAALAKAYAEYKQKGGTSDVPKWHEETVHFLQVTPADAKPVKVVGKDFTLTAYWDKFKVYSPDSDFQQADPYYSGYTNKSPTAARKFYRIVKQNPDALKSIGYGGLDNWLAKNGIAIEHLHSVWH